MTERLHRRFIGWLRQRLSDPALGAVAEPRREHGRVWTMQRVLATVVAAMVVGRKGLREVEAFTEEASLPALEALGLRRSLPDTTMRDLLVKLDVHELRGALHRQVRQAHRRHALEPTKLPWGVVSMDGKVTSIGAWDSPYVQRNGSKGLMRTVTATLVSSDVRVCLDAFPIAAKTNEMGTFQTALTALLGAYRSLDLFRVVLYDAGACSQDNAAFTRSVGLHYAMVLNEAQPTLYAEARRVLGSLGPEQGVEVQADGGRTVRYTLWSTEEMAGWLDWTHLRTVHRIRREELGPDGQVLQVGERYFVTSLRAGALSARGWARLFRARWGVENDCHNTFDTVFGEDERPWFLRSAVGALAVLMLRRIAYNLVALFRGRTLRGEQGARPPWKDVMRRAYNACIAATAQTVAGLRAPRPAS